jgi:hypothetical protein
MEFEVLSQEDVDSLLKGISGGEFDYEDEGPESKPGPVIHPSAEVLFKIQNQEGKFSTGGIHPIFTKIGKAYTKSRLYQHLKLLEKYHKTMTIYENCVVVQFIIHPYYNKSVQEWKERNAAKS